ncbi:MATE efflux family protein [Marvinbryantia formatexigens DSM 14469]|uniref:Multidrug export protein MepA n=1 Tax=Marvinbryantia formatexigens DSM 14469 TaxID=478749 RepID=C6LLT6_9FIRM|nr:MATE family efflux transporter [Marvinbryantia formatexigens]EET58405.1 MATE efflux family protein [Marvinbryantia formatexigens DSM 14469]UWO26372.1 MATE family efflux transporter [Marvinbryantia formatexigens DSM 14469]SDH24353.1 putative efflux protein, MATE family [Marvinbryantia formatexigens]
MAIQLSDHFTYKKLLRFCTAPIIMMVFTSIYGVVDGLFVSNFVGKVPFAAINLVMPFIMILGGFGFMIGTGGSALVAKTLGEGNKTEANRYFTMMILLTIISGIALSVIGILLMRPISRLLGATDAMMEDCVTYGRVVLLFNTAYMLQNVFQTFFTTAEKPKLGLFATVAAGVTNMVLDALFIAVFRWGVAGAALATGISQCIGGLLPLLYFLRPNGSLLRLTKTKLEARVLCKACANGSSELMSNISGSLVSMLYNFQLMRFAGENGVAAYGVLMYIQFIFIAIFIGYTIGTAPIIGYHYGAGNRGELKNMLRKSFLLMAAAGICMMLAAKILAAPLAAIFVGYDQELLEMTRHAFSVFSYSFILAGLNIFTSSYFTALNNGVVSAIISFSRTLVFQTLSVLILPIFLGLDGIWWAITVAEVLAFVVSFFFLRRKKLNPALA